ncbi:MAG: hypothetical protein ABI353_00535 [Isosphaeraceae bacterium]
MRTRQEAATTGGLVQVLASLVVTALIQIPSTSILGAEGPEPASRSRPPRTLERLPLVHRSLTLNAQPPLREQSHDPTLRQTSDSLPKADAGDDQIGLVGRRITLNGSLSEPSGQLGYRWIQLGGPQAVSMVQDQYILSFTPQVPGVYRFALLVAADSAISEPATVDVTVGIPPAPLATAAPPVAQPPALVPPPPPPPPIDELARTALASLNDGASAAEPLSSTFEALADRMDLYKSYSDLFSEMSRRLDAFVPREPAIRAVWIDRLFTPLTGRMVEQLRVEGLDLTHPGAASVPLTPAQKVKLVELFRSISQGFQSSPPSE